MRRYRFGLSMTDAVEKVPKCLLAIFSKETKLNYARRLIWHPGRCRSRLWIFSLGDEVPHIFIRESHQRPRKILITGGNCPRYRGYRPPASPAAARASRLATVPPRQQA